MASEALSPLAGPRVLIEARKALAWPLSQRRSRGA